MMTARQHYALIGKARMLGSDRSWRITDEWYVFEASEPLTCDGYLCRRMIEPGERFVRKAVTHKGERFSRVRYCGSCEPFELEQAEALAR